VLVRADGSVCITDFGVAKVLKPGERTYTVCGTVDYFTPELLTKQGEAPHSPRCLPTGTPASLFL
jgi:serine/threonine protein kinase